MRGSFVEPQSSGLYLLSQCDQLLCACVAADCEWVLLVVVDQRTRRAEGLVVVAAGVGVLEVLDLAVHLTLLLMFVVIHMWIISVKHLFTQNKIFFYGVAELGGLVVVLGGWVVALGSGLAVVGLGQLPVNEPVCRVGYIYD